MELTGILQTKKLFLYFNVDIVLVVCSFRMGIDKVGIYSTVFQF